MDDFKADEIFRLIEPYWAENRPETLRQATGVSFTDGERKNGNRKEKASENACEKLKEERMRKLRKLFLFAVALVALPIGIFLMWREIDKRDYIATIKEFTRDVEDVESVELLRNHLPGKYDYVRILNDGSWVIVTERYILYKHTDKLSDIFRVPVRCVRDSRGRFFVTTPPFSILQNLGGVPLPEGAPPLPRGENLDEFLPSLEEFLAHWGYRPLRQLL